MASLTRRGFRDDIAADCRLCRVVIAGSGGHRFSCIKVMFMKPKGHVVCSVALVTEEAFGNGDHGFFSLISPQGINALGISPDGQEHVVVIEFAVFLRSNRATSRKNTLIMRSDGHVISVDFTAKIFGDHGFSDIRLDFHMEIIAISFEVLGRGDIGMSSNSNMIMGADLRSAVLVIEVFGRGKRGTVPNT